MFTNNKKKKPIIRLANFAISCNKKRELIIQSILALFKLDAGNVLSSQEVALQVFSPLQVFTTVFGMGTGGLPTISHQRNLYAEDYIKYKLTQYQFNLSVWVKGSCEIKDFYVAIVQLRCRMLTASANSTSATASMGVR